MDIDSHSFLLNIENSLSQHWDLPALTDYKGETFLYKDLSLNIKKLHLLFDTIGIQKGDKIALSGRNSSGWATTFFSILSYGAVAVPILHEFTSQTIEDLVRLSESRLLFVGNIVWESINAKETPGLEAILMLNDFSVVYSKTLEKEKLDNCFHLGFKEKYGERGILPNNLAFHRDQPEELAIISYTSGTSNLPKGVMIPYRALLSNLLFACEVIPDFNVGNHVISILPLAHMYGLSFELIFETTQGGHIHFLPRLPSPKIVAEAFTDISPHIIISVPLIIDKIYKSRIKYLLNRRSVKLLLKVPILNILIRKIINRKLTLLFGGQFIQLIIGGAPLQQETDIFFHKIGFKYTVGYGMTECAPIITFANWKTAKLFSCGKVVKRMELRIDSPDPQRIVGEVQVRGENVTLGYYKNEQATQELFTSDGWMKTGDLGIIDADGLLFIKGRSKNMILGPSGQNIFPEEIEDKILSDPYVSETLIVEKEGRLTALVYPDIAKLDEEGISIDEYPSIMKKTQANINQKLPSYCQIATIKIRSEEFEKTPKRSIKRYLYQDME